MRRWSWSFYGEQHEHKSQWRDHTSRTGETVFTKAVVVRFIRAVQLNKHTAIQLTSTAKLGNKDYEMNNISGYLSTNGFPTRPRVFLPLCLSLSMSSSFLRLWSRVVYWLPLTPCAP